VAPEILRYASIKTWQTLNMYPKQTGRFSYETHWSAFNDAHYNGRSSFQMNKTLFSINDAYIPTNESVDESDGVMFESANSFKDAVNGDAVRIDTGTVISVQKFDHASVSPDILSPDFSSGTKLELAEHEINKEVLMGYDAVRFAPDSYVKRNEKIEFAKNFGSHPTLNERDYAE